MNKLSFTISAALMSLTLGTSAMAQAADAGKTRAEVIAELEQARASGDLARSHAEVGVGGYQAPNLPRQALPSVAVKAPAAAVPAKPAAAVAAEGKTRAEVLAELARARASGELEALHSEGGPGYFPAPVGRINGAPVLAGQPRSGN
ncbi:DUF4148 domain-containing protein [Paucibacter sp. AS339]|uniref:DUF4148 domain-containing protein n=1 Tax=Paucibacter hankyongi TaxID=3133434 RepID=UPI0030AAEBF3